MANYKKKISELTALNSASLDTVVVGVDNGTTYKIELDVLADGVRDRINTLDDVRLTALEAFTSSTNNASLNSFTASHNAWSGGVLLTSSFNTFSASVHTQILAATNEQSLAHLVTTASFNTFTSSQYLSNSYFATTGSNTFRGENVFEDKITINHNLIVTGSALFGSGAFNELAPEKFLVTQDDPNNYNIVVAEANTNNYSQIVVWNKNNGISASSDLIAQADNGGETNMYADLGVNSSNFTGNGNGIGRANDAYVYGKAKDFWVGNLTSQSLYIFANPNGVADITLENGIFSISGSLIVSGGITGSLDYSHITNKPNGIISASSQLTSSYDLRYAPSASYLTSLNGALSSSIQVLGGSGIYSSSTQLPDGLVSGSSQLTSSYDVRYVISGSITQTTWDNIASKPNGIVSGSSQLTSSFDTRYAFSGSAGVVPDGTISGSSQLTASFDTRYAFSGSAGVVPQGTISGSAQITDFGFVSGSYETTGRDILSGSVSYNNLTNIPSGIVSSSSQILDGSGIWSGSAQLPSGVISGSSQLVSVFAQLNGGNTFNGIQIFNDPIQASSISASSLTVTTFYAVSSSVATTTGSTSFGSLNTDTMFVTGSIRASNDISASTINGFGNATQYSASVNTRISGLEALTSSYETKGRGIISGSSQLTSSFIQASQTSSMTAGFSTYASNIAVISTGTTTDSTLYPVFTINSASNGFVGLRNHLSGSYYFDGVTRKLYAESFVGSIEATNGLISGSSQLTASYDGRYTLSGSVSAVPAGTISGSSQLTASFDSRYLITGSVTSSINQLNTFTASISTASLVTSITNLNTTTASLQSQLATIGGQSGSWGGGASLTSLNTFSASINTFTASHNTWSGTVDGRFSTLASYTASVNTTTASLNTFTSSINIWTSSIATTGSNSFNGAQVITGSLIVTTGSFIGSTIIANTSSLYLTSGSNLYVQNAGLVEISGSLKVSGSTIYTGSISISSGSITMPNRPAFRVVGNASTDRSAGLTLSGSAVTVDYNEGNYFNTTNGKFTAPLAGLYNVYLNARVGSVNAAQQVIIYKNSNVVQLMWEAAGNTGAVHFGVSGILKLAVNDTLEAKVAVGSIQFDGNDNWGATYMG